MEAQAFDNSAGSPVIRRRLGRGLSALLGNGADADSQDSPGVIPMYQPSAAPAPGADDIALEMIERSPSQPRRDFDQIGRAHV